MNDQDKIDVPGYERLFEPDMTLEEVIGIAGGAFSVCWTEQERRFDSERANFIRDQVIQWINENTTILEPTRSKGEKIIHECLREEEPFFVFRARDIFTIMVLRKYAQLVDDFGPNDFDFSEGVHDHMETVRDWQRKHPRQVKYPD